MHVLGNRKYSGQERCAGYGRVPGNKKLFLRKLTEAAAEYETALAREDGPSERRV